MAPIQSNEIVIKMSNCFHNINLSAIVLLPNDKLL